MYDFFFDIGVNNQDKLDDKRSWGPKRMILPFGTIPLDIRN